MRMILYSSLIFKTHFFPSHFNVFRTCMCLTWMIYYNWQYSFLPCVHKIMVCLNIQCHFKVWWSTVTFTFSKIVLKIRDEVHNSSDIYLMLPLQIEDYKIRSKTQYKLCKLSKLKNWRPMLSEAFQSSEPPTLSLHASRCILPVLISLRFIAKCSRCWGLWEALSPAQVWTYCGIRWKSQQRENQNVTSSRLEYVAYICG